VVGKAFEITYAAHTATCTFLLDGEGICRRIVMSPGSKRREAAKNAARCIGAQYVATLDASVPGCLVELPKPGLAMVFARVDENGRIALVRTGSLTAFETKKREEAPDPFAESIGVMTSAPAAREVTTPRVRPPHADPYVQSDRTQRVPELSSNDLPTDEYESDPRTTWPQAQKLPTLHDPHVQHSPVDDDDDPYAERVRQDRRSEPVPKGSWQDSQRHLGRRSR